MARKENKGGTLTNQQIEEELQRTGRQPENQTYHGSQDTGDDVVRNHGTQVQQEDGTGEQETEQ